MLQTVKPGNYKKLILTWTDPICTIVCKTQNNMYDISFISKCLLFPPALGKKSETFFCIAIVIPNKGESDF